MGPVLDVGDIAVSKIVRIAVLAEFTSKWETQISANYMVIDLIKSVIRATKEMGLMSIYAWATCLKTIKDVDTV